MSDMIQVLQLGNEEIPQAWAANTSYRMTHSEAKYLLIIAERKDGLQDMFLFRQANGGEELLSQRVLPFDLKQVLKGKLTGTLIQQIQLRHKLGNGNEQTILRDLSSVFRRSREMMQMFQNFADVLTSPHGYSARDIHRFIGQIVDQCELDLERYAQFFKKKSSENTMFHLFNGMFMEWNGVTRMINAFLESQELDNAVRASLHIVMCGSLLTAAALAEPTIANNCSVLYTAGNRSRIYQMTAEMLHSDSLPRWNLTLQLNRYPYHAKLQEAYVQYRQKHIHTVRSQIAVFHDILLILPAKAGIYAGSRQGKFYPFNGMLVQSTRDCLLTAPFSEAFSALIAQGKVILERTAWTRYNDGWQFETEFTYHEKKWHPAPKRYDASHIRTASEFPAAVMFMQQGDERMRLYVESCRPYRLSLYRGEKFESVVRAVENTRAYYFKITEGSQFVGQVVYSREGGKS